MDRDFFTAAYPWVPDKGDGTYSNPVLFADYSDPDVIRVGKHYYLISSSFCQSPGLPVLHSLDLVNWEILGYALQKLPGEKYKEVQPGCGVWAPAIRYHDSKFWIFFPMPDEGIFVTTAEDPAGPWSEPWLLLEGKGLIDPCPLWDNEGKGWLIFAYAYSRSGIKNKLHIRPMNSNATALMGEGRIVFDGTLEHPTIEGPKIYKKKEYYYISAPAGGVSTGWQVILRSKEIYGPYEVKTVLAQRGSPINGPHQGALVDDIEGNWWFLHFQEHQPYGRICHLQPVTWDKDWPFIGIDQDEKGTGKPVLTFKKPAGETDVVIPQTSDEFSMSTLGEQWAFQAEQNKDWYSLTAREGFLRLYGQKALQGNLAKAPHILIQKLPTRQFNCETELDYAPEGSGSEAGLAVLGNENTSLAITNIEGVRSLILRRDENISLRQPCPAGPVKMRLRFGDGGFFQFGYSGDYKTNWFGPVYQAREGKWIGARIGIYCSVSRRVPLKTHGDFSYFRFGPFTY